ncbi:DUF2946 family protein [Phenylobacterium sp.]|uniref:DUF2946 family protein n=1 Tax=Phenylobacterium sp. TaxID=1871053 RepID=UPI002730B92E|nr:DUF2946 family protein [Phenylobacterium sp.]MDP2214020.1 hypothetical protein [Phenylobacterium sp.]
MTRVFGNRLARLLAVTAVTLQMLLPGSLAVAGTNGGDLSRLMCAPSGEISAETRAAAARLADITGEQRPDPAPSDDHCALCTLPYAAGPNTPTFVAAPCRFAVEVEPAPCQPGLVHRTQGPPLGSRAPPPRT